MRYLVKNILLLIVTMVALNLLKTATTAFATDGLIYSQALQTLFEQWETSGYPDDIGGIFIDDEISKVVFLIVNPTPERTDELSKLFPDEVLYKPCKYPYNELRIIQSEIATIMNSNNGIYGIGIGNSVDGHGNGKSGREFRTIVNVDESVLDHYRKGFTALYNDRVVVVVGKLQKPMAEDDNSDSIATNDKRNPIVPVDISVALAGSVFFTDTNTTNNSILLATAMCIGLMGALLILMKLRSRPFFTLQTNTGSIFMTKPPLSRKQTITVIKKSALTPSDDLFNSIKKKIETL